MLYSSGTTGRPKGIKRPLTGLQVDDPSYSFTLLMLTPGTDEPVVYLSPAPMYHAAPLRWSVAHYYQAILDDEPHVPKVAFLTTLAGYVHWRLTGRKVLGVGDASGMFPVDSATGSYDASMLASFDELTAIARTSSV